MARDIYLSSGSGEESHQIRVDFFQILFFFLANTLIVDYLCIDCATSFDLFCHCSYLGAMCVASVHASMPSAFLCVSVLRCYEKEWKKIVKFNNI